MRMRSLGWLATPLALALSANAIRAQSLSISGSATASIPVPKEADYTNGASAVSMNSITVLSDCSGQGSSGCSIKISYPSGTNSMDVQFSLTSLTKTQGGTMQNCTQSVAAGFIDVPPSTSPTVLYTADKGANCSATLVLKVKNLTYTT